MKTPTYIAAHIRRVLENGASAPHSEEVQRFFKEEVSSRGWYTDELRKVAKRFRKALLNDAGLDFLVAVADKLFRGRVLEEKVFGVFLLEGSESDLTDAHFKLFESWLDRISSWADHDSLIHYVIGPMIAGQPRRAARAFAWARSKNRWHRRAAAVSLIRGARRQMFAPEIIRMSNLLLADQDDMVQKGLGWLLRETAKYNPDAIVPHLMKIRAKAPRLVLRTACEKLPANLRAKILERETAVSSRNRFNRHTIPAS